MVNICKAEKIMYVVNASLEHCFSNMRFMKRLLFWSNKLVWN